ncbi:MAG TPA: hypothetical protein PKD80_09175 [Microthrixaceae bacterium]|nr:hypothetical protein [Microthrixaceae bacterium]
MTLTLSPLERGTFTGFGGPIGPPPDGEFFRVPQVEAGNVDETLWPAFGRSRTEGTSPRALPPGANRTQTAPTTPQRRRRIGAAIVAGLATFGIVGASAASLGGVTSTTLGADVGVVSSCDTDGVSLSFTNSYDATLGRYQTTTVNIGGIAAACSGKALSITLKDATGASVGSGSIATLTASASQSATIAAPGANANAVTGAAVVITG